MTLGFDDMMSTDHHWGPRAMLFLQEEVLAAHGPAIRDVLAERLPPLFIGYSTHWSAPDPNDNGVQKTQPLTGDRVNHRVELFSLQGFFSNYLGIDAEESLAPADWLTLPWQKLRSVVSGRVFRDDLGIEKVRDRLRWYPHDLWLYVMASCWTRIGQEEHLMGRAGQVGDEVGSTIIAARLARDMMRLAFLMARVYPPYPKWFGRAFAELDCAAVLQPILHEILHGPGWRERDRALAVAYRHLAEMHNALAVTPPLPSEPTSFFGRPFTVIHGDRFATALRDAITDPWVTSLAARPLIGTVDLISDNTDLLENTGRRTALRELFKPRSVSDDGNAAVRPNRKTER